MDEELDLEHELDLEEEGLGSGAGGARGPSCLWAINSRIAKMSKEEIR